MKTKSIFLVLGFFILFVNSAFTQIETELSPLKSKTLSPKSVDRTFTRLIKANMEVQTVEKYLTSKGYQAQREPNNFYGISETYKYSVSKQKIVYKFIFQDYLKPNSKDPAALCQLSAISKDTAATYTFYLIAPNGDFANMEEYFVDQKLNIQLANSWWGCTKKRIAKKCPGECLDAFISCVPAGATSVVAYLGCVVGKCGKCLIKAGACCACDCRKFCKWATGCCDK